MSNNEALIPKSFVLRWLQESTTTDDFRTRLDRYIEKNPTNWNLGD